MPLPKIIAKAVVGSIKGKKAGQAAGTAAAKKAAAAKVAKAKAVAAKKDAAASARGLKAAQGPSMAPKGYTADDARRLAQAALNVDRKIKYPTKGKNPLSLSEIKRLEAIVKGSGPVNVVSKSGKTAKNK
jgi:hypothetical protein